MAEVDTLRGLLVDCVQDLREGEELTCTRSAVVIAAAHAARLKAILTRRAEQARARAQALDTIASGLGMTARGPENFWMGSMFDDAGRDTEMVAQGPLLDAALIGAVRKMTVAALVSYETAIAAADTLGLADAAHVLRQARMEESEADSQLAEALASAIADSLQN